MLVYICICPNATGNGVRFRQMFFFLSNLSVMRRTIYNAEGPNYTSSMGLGKPNQIIDGYDRLAFYITVGT